MNYTKPEVNTLGQAKSVIENLHKKPTTAQIEGSPLRNVFDPAYDLDE
jgi:hypothetical protein